MISISMNKLTFCPVLSGKKIPSNKSPQLENQQNKSNNKKNNNGKFKATTTQPFKGKIVTKVEKGIAYIKLIFFYNQS